jgi:ABC-type transporter MlaC component
LQHSKSKILHAFAASAAALLIALVPARILAAPPAADPADTVREVVDSLRKLHTTTEPAARARELASIDGALAVEPLCRQALGAQWSKLSAAQRKHFVTLIVSLLHKFAYPKAAEFFSALHMEYRADRPRSGARIVETTVKRGDGGAVSIDYLVEKEGGRWKIRDILLDRQSLAANVASQIQAVLKQGSYAELVRQMEARLKQKGS